MKTALAILTTLAMFGLCAQGEISQAAPNKTSPAPSVRPQAPRGSPQTPSVPSQPTPHITHPHQDPPQQGRQLTMAEVGEIHVKGLATIPFDASMNFDKKMQLTTKFLIEDYGVNSEMTQTIGHKIVETVKKLDLLDRSGRLKVNTKTVKTIIKHEMDRGFISKDLASQLNKIADLTDANPKADIKGFVDKINNLSPSGKNDSVVISMLQSITNASYANPPPPAPPARPRWLTLLIDAGGALVGGAVGSVFGPVGAAVGGAAGGVVASSL